MPLEFYNLGFNIFCIVMEFEGLFEHVSETVDDLGVLLDQNSLVTTFEEDILFLEGKQKCFFIEGALNLLNLELRKDHFQIVLDFIDDLWCEISLPR